MIIFFSLNQYNIIQHSIHGIITVDQAVVIYIIQNGNRTNNTQA